MIDYISNVFEFLDVQRGYRKSSKDINFVVKSLIYTKGVVSVMFTCELIELQFDFKVSFSDSKGTHIVKEYNEPWEKHNQVSDKKITYHSIFEYTEGIWSPIAFQDAKECLLYKVYGFGKAKKIFRDRIHLYRSLIKNALDKIESEVLSDTI